MPIVRIHVGENYTTELDARLRRLKISRGELSRESGISKSHLARWFNTDMNPSMKNIERIERAIIAITKRRERAAKAAAKRKADKRNNGK